MRRPPILAVLVPLVLALSAGVGLLSFTAPATAAAETPPPVVLLHGWHGEGDDTLEGSSLAPLGPRLRAAGHPLRWADGIGLDRSESVYDAAERLGAVLREEAQAHPGRPISLVAHSYGGIVARAYLESDRYAQDRRAGLRVGALVTVGTPMAGIDLWLPLLFLLGDPTDEPSVWELTPAFMEHFNRAHRPRPDLRYTVIAGDARRQVAALRLLPPSDGVVTLGSALSLDERRFGHRETVTGDLHGKIGPSWLGWEHYFQNERTWREAILPGLAPLGAGTEPELAAASSADRDADSPARVAGPGSAAPYTGTTEAWAPRGGPAFLADAGSLAAARGAEPEAAFLLAGRGPGAERAARASDGFHVTGLPGVAPFWAWVASPGGPDAAFATGDATVAAMALGGAGREDALDAAGRRDPRFGEDEDAARASLGPGYHVVSGLDVHGPRARLGRSASAARAVVRPDPGAGTLETLARDGDGLRVSLRLRDAGRYLLRAELAGGEAVSAWRRLPAGRSELLLALDANEGPRANADAARADAVGSGERARVWLWAADAGLVPILEAAAVDLRGEALSGER